jgi:hypothetical protein
MTQSNLPVPSSSKRQKIRELTLAGFSPEAIVDKLNTTFQYVYKERGRLRADGFSITHQALSISTNQNKNEIAVGESKKNLRMKQMPYESGIDQSTFYDIPPLEKDDVKTMYQAFKNKENAADVVGKYGFNPMISHVEYDRYLNIIARNPSELQRRLLSRIYDPSHIITILKEKSKSELLSNNELMEVIEFIIEKSVAFNIARMVSDSEVSLPQGFSRLLCSSCHRPQAGVLFDSRTLTGLFVTMAGVAYKCNICDNQLSTK